MSGFSNAIVGGIGTLIRTYVQSLGFVTGVTGWRISRNGDAEFNSGTFRGPVLIGGPPSQGAISIGLTGTAIPLVLRNFNADYTWFEADIRWIDATQFFFTALVRNTNFAVTEIISGVYTTGGGVQIQQLTESTTPNTVNHGTNTYDTARLLETWRKADVLLDTTTTFVSQGFNQTGPIVSDIVGIAEGWHAITLANGWVNYGGGEVTAQYRLVPSPANCVEVIGLIKSGTTADATVIGTLPVGYRPTHHIPGWAASSVNGARATRIDLQTNGTLTILGVGAAGDLAFHNLYPIDA
jgi:hypothetical protein